MIHFVGAGPGAPDLITVRGARLLQSADMVVYAGSLVNPELLGLCREGCTVHDSAPLTLEEVVAIMMDADAQGLQVVRLHTGDPSLYGAIREQMDALDVAGIAYDVCPGVSAFSAAAAALSAEYTLPGVSQSLVISRAQGRTPVPEAEQLRHLAAHGSSLALYLSAGLAGTVQEELLAAGLAPDTPAALVYKASWPDEYAVRCTVGTLAETASAHGIAKTALILVGDFLNGAQERSCLYDPAFSHGFREASRE